MLAIELNLAEMNPGPASGVFGERQGTWQIADHSYRKVAGDGNAHKLDALRCISLS